ncbi:class Ib ribonucleoside-diphosphate reductase assembly flavoprotein NrdI [Streptococcus thoraltensis]|uniref:class Ib ribonucleoside-diphosphate reductase assembly flavoprotein NrdI n=1 Tax=Streptococcus thoraltensis TaxID=55085 RepID=UPI003BF4EBBB
MEDKLAHCQDTISNGNRNAPDFCREARELSQKYHLLLLYTFEFSGTAVDTNIVKGMLSNES